MYRIDTDGSVAGAFADGDPGTGVAGTKVDAAWLNAVQEELCGLLEALGLTLAKANSGQLLSAINTNDRFVRAWGTVDAQSGTLTLRDSYGVSLANPPVFAGTDQIKVNLDVPLADNNFAVLVTDDGCLAGSSNSAGVGIQVTAKDGDGAPGSCAYFAVKWVGVADITTGTWAMNFLVFGTHG